MVSKGIVTDMIQLTISSQHCSEIVGAQFSMESKVQNATQNVQESCNRACWGDSPIVAVCQRIHQSRHRISRDQLFQHFPHLSHACVAPDQINDGSFAAINMPGLGEKYRIFGDTPYIFQLGAQSRVGEWPSCKRCPGTCRTCMAVWASRPTRARAMWLPVRRQTSTISVPWPASRTTSVRYTICNDYTSVEPHSLHTPAALTICRIHRLLRFPPVRRPAQRGVLHEESRRR